MSAISSVCSNDTEIMQSFRLEVFQIHNKRYPLIRLLSKKDTFLAQLQNVGLL